MKAIYLADSANGILVGPVELPVVPGIGVQFPDNAIELPKALDQPAEGFVWVLVKGKAVLTADHRGMVYSTATGEVKPHETLGDLPEGFTEQPWPGLFHVWSGAGWFLDAAAELEAAHAAERVWRNGQIAVTDYLAMPDYPLTAEQRLQLYAYRQALRDWPDVSTFPDQAARPQPPVWIVDFSQ